jgi:hypothetical protein
MLSTVGSPHSFKDVALENFESWALKPRQVVKRRTKTIIRKLIYCLTQIVVEALRQKLGVTRNTEPGAIATGSLIRLEVLLRHVAIAPGSASMDAGHQAAFRGEALRGNILCQFYDELSRVIVDRRSN